MSGSLSHALLPPQNEMHIGLPVCCQTELPHQASSSARWDSILVSGSNTPQGVHAGGNPVPHPHPRTQNHEANLTQSHLVPTPPQAPGPAAWSPEQPRACPTLGHRRVGLCNSNLCDPEQPVPAPPWPPAGVTQSNPCLLHPAARGDMKQPRICLTKSHRRALTATLSNLCLLYPGPWDSLAEAIQAIHHAPHSGRQESIN